MSHAVQGIAQQQTQCICVDLFQGLRACVCALCSHAFLKRKQGDCKRNTISAAKQKLTFACSVAVMPSENFFPPMVVMSNQNKSSGYLKRHQSNNSKRSVDLYNSKWESMTVIIFPNSTSMTLEVHQKSLKLMDPVQGLISHSTQTWALRTHLNSTQTQSFRTCTLPDLGDSLCIPHKPSLQGLSLHSPQTQSFRTHTDFVSGESPHIPHRSSSWGLKSEFTQTRSLGTHLTIHKDPVLWTSIPHRPSPWLEESPHNPHRPSPLD